jgi:hypothetical protein
MTNKDLVALADALRIHNRTADARTEFTPDLLKVLAEFFTSQVTIFRQERWIDYITGKCGQGDELIFVDCGRIGAAVERKIAPIPNRDEGSPRRGLAAPDRDRVKSFKPR